MIVLVSRSPASRECGCRPKLNTHQPDTAFSKQHSPFPGKGGEVIATLRHGFCRNDALARSDSRVSATGNEGELQKARSTRTRAHVILRPSRRQDNVSDSCNLQICSRAVLVASEERMTGLAVVPQCNILGCPSGRAPTRGFLPCIFLTRNLAPWPLPLWPRTPFGSGPVFSWPPGCPPC